MKKLLLVCPSRKRPYRLMDMIKTVDATIDPDYTQLIILLDKDDPTLGQYFEKIPPHVMVRVYDREGDKTYTTEIINRIYEEFPDYSYYSVTNDDIHYKTKGWDKALSQKYKISCGKDKTMEDRYGKDCIANINPSTFPITSIIDGDIIRAIGWLQYPELIHSAGDNIWYWIGRRSNCLYTDDSYETEHMSAYFGKGEADETFQRCNARDNKQDYYTYIEWLKYKCGKELIKVEKLIKEKQSCMKLSKELAEQR